MSGKQMVLTMRLDGFERAIDNSGNWPELWHDIKTRMRAERKAHRALKQADFDEKQHAFADEVNAAYNDDPPLGVLAVEPWSTYGQ
jgi:hypothetical protein